MVDDEDYEWLNQWKWYAVKYSNLWYAGRTLNRKNKTRMIFMHREILQSPNNQVVDHRDSNGLNNQRSNIRLCMPNQNSMNRRKQEGASSRYKGVAWHKRDKKWQCGIRYFKKSYHLGYFKSEQEAAEQYDIAAQIFFGEFARLNF